MLKIRLTRMGKKHQPSYRIVVMPKENPVAGRYIDLIGTYNPLKEQVQIDTEKAVEWLNKGAQPSERIARLLSKAGVKHNSVVVKMYTPKPKEEPKAEAATTPAESEVTDETAEETPASEQPEAEATDNTESAPSEQPEPASEEAAEPSEESKE